MDLNRLNPIELIINLSVDYAYRQVMGSVNKENSNTDQKQQNK